MKEPANTPKVKHVYVTPFISKAIIYYREMQHITQKQLAAASGLSLSAIKRLETGRKRGGWAESQEAVCVGLAIKLTELIATADRLAEAAQA